jgi:hypothetical protein
MDLATLKQTAKRINKQAGRQIYKMIEINKIKEDHVKHELDMELRARRGFTEYTKVDKKVGILMYWGDIPSEDDKNIKERQLVMVANEKYVIRNQDNPFLHKRPPHVLTVPLVYPHRGIAGSSIVEPMVSMQYAYNNITNLAVDNMNFSVNKMFEVQPTNLLNARNATDIYPGKMFKKHSSAEAVREIRVSQLGQDVFTMFDFIGREMEKGTAVTEFIMGSSGKSKTATEAELKTAQAQGLFDVIARDIEASSLQPLIEMSFELLVQFGVIPQRFSGRYDFKVGGVSLLLAQREQGQQLSEALGIALKSPDIAAMTDMQALYRKWLESRNLGDVYSEQPQQLPSGQVRQIRQQAQKDAKEAASGLNEQQIMQLAGAR